MWLVIWYKEGKKRETSFKKKWKAEEFCDRIENKDWRYRIVCVMYTPFA